MLRQRSKVLSAALVAALCGLPA
ncbi:MAG: hypothetical protein QOJ29_5005, partial [Thermoleophilaceae bacterium]|nr:hypothetical protein [Thermoleophilaceae bacterium]